MSLWHEERLYIDGELVAAESGRTYDTVNPATEEVLGVAADATPLDVRRAIAAARRAFDETDWSTDAGLRIRTLRSFYEAVEERVEELGEILVAEAGAPASLLQGFQLAVPIESLDYYADLLTTYSFTDDHGLTDPLPGYGGQSHRWVEKEAAGVVAAITAYNFPIMLAMAKIAPALAAGCTVILKGAPQTPWANLALGAIADEAGLPPGVFNVITSSDNAVAAELTTHPDVDLITFTGSTAVGKQIMSAAADTVKKVFLELGGKSALLALDDADLRQAVVATTTAISRHSGQGCALTTRLVVPRGRYEEAIEYIKEVAPQIRIGDPRDPENFGGPLITSQQLEKVETYVEEAVAAGAEVVIGGKRPDNPTRGYYYEPTVLRDVDEQSAIAQDELFGPVLAILPHDGDDDAVRIANGTVFGLSGQVLSADVDRARSVARRIRSGTVGINGGIIAGFDVPFGGYKQSGVGRENGLLGFEEFLEVKLISEPVTTP